MFSAGESLRHQHLQIFTTFFIMYFDNKEKVFFVDFFWVLLSSTIVTLDLFQGL